MSKGYHVLLGGYLLLIGFVIFTDYMAALSKYEFYQRDWTDWSMIFGIICAGLVTLLSGLARKKD